MSLAVPEWPQPTIHYVKPISFDPDVLADFFSQKPDIMIVGKLQRELMDEALQQRRDAIFNIAPLEPMNF